MEAGLENQKKYIEQVQKKVLNSAGLLLAASSAPNLDVKKSDRQSGER